MAGKAKGMSEAPFPLADLLPAQPTPPDTGPRAGRSASAPERHQDGHRDRLRERFFSAGDAALADYELLELLLFRLIPRRDVKPLAKALLKRFGTIADVLNAPLHLLTEVDGMGPSSALDLHVVAAIHRRSMQSGIRGREVLASWSAVLDYCHAAMAHETREQFRILFLDKRNALIADEVQQTGTVDHTPVYPREILRRAIELSATAVVLVHNHPSGDPQPSRSDVEVTKAIAEAAEPLGVAVHDHLIIGRNGHCSLKAMKLF